MKPNFLSVGIFVMVTMAMATPYAYNGLSYDYYKYSCPKVESISKRITKEFVAKDPTLAAGLIRMDFHDCIVNVMHFNLSHYCGKICVHVTSLDPKKFKITFTFYEFLKMCGYMLLPVYELYELKQYWTL